MVELCPFRLNLSSGRRSVADWWRQKKSFASIRRFIFLSLASDWLGLEPHLGAEAAAVVHEAAKRGIRVVFGDRDIWITILHGWNYLSWWERVEISFGMLFGRFGRVKLSPPSVSELEKKNSDMTNEIIRQMANGYKSLRPLPKDQGRYIASSLRRLDRPLRQLTPSSSEVRNRGRVLTVLGAGYSSQVLSLLDQKENVDRKALSSAPPLYCGPIFYVSAAFVLLFVLCTAVIWAASARYLQPTGWAMTRQPLVIEKHFAGLPR
jgi:pheromone shutdown protein TraB